MRAMRISSAMSLVALLTLAAFAHAEESLVDCQMTEDIVYGHKDGLALTLDVLQPLSKPIGKAVIVVSSGSWVSKKSDIPDANPLRARQRVQGLLQGGYTLFVVRHGSSPRYAVPDMIPDMNRAVRFVRSVAGRFNVDPDHLAITGFSSGGHLSLMAGMTGDNGNPNSKDPVERFSSRVQCVMAWFPPTDLVNWGAPNTYRTIDTVRPEFYKRIIGDVKDLESQLKAVSPIYLVNADSPPLLLIHGDSDKTVPLQQSEILKARYEELGLKVKLIVQPGGGHGAWPEMVDHYVTVCEWFRQHLN